MHSNFEDCTAIGGSSKDILGFKRAYFKLALKSQWIAISIPLKLAFRTKLYTIDKAIPPFFFRLASNAFPDVGSVGRIERKKKT